MPRARSRPALRNGPTLPTSSAIRKLRGPLLRWYRRHRRDLPWRNIRDPYAIWVSEVMLQQTRVATVIPYYARFMERFPDPHSLARAPEDEVLSLWSGLGYYGRARALHRGARAVMERGGELPRDPRELRRLPGIGRYTAGAIASVAFELPEPVLDGNVRRVLSRRFAVGGTGASAEKLLWEIAGHLAGGPDPGDLNQALMELGALVCTPRKPKCLLCPLVDRCRARAEGDPEAYPRVRPARATETVRVAVPLVKRSGRFLLERPRDGSPLRGTWDVPALQLGDRADARSRITSTLAKRYDLTVAAGRLAGTASHGILHRRLKLEIYDCRLLRGRVSGQDGLRWMPLADLESTPVSGATKKVLRLSVNPTD